MASAVAKSSKYTYRSTGGAGTADVSIEYSADLSALSRLEVGPVKKTSDMSSSLGKRTTAMIKILNIFSLIYY